MSKSETLTAALCSLSKSERALLIEFWDRQRRGQTVNAAMLIDIARPRMPQSVSAAFAKYRLLEILRTDKRRKCYWPRHHSPTDFGLQVIALILGTQSEPN